MKIRQGMVSNSSSSSFIIASNITDGKKFRNKMNKVISDVLMVPEASPIHYLVEEMSLTLLRADCYTIEELVRELEFESVDDLLKYHPEVKQALAKGFKDFYSGSVSNEDGGTDEILNSLELHYSDDEIVIEKDAF